MIILLSPAKTLDFEGPMWPCIADGYQSVDRPGDVAGDAPVFLDRSRELVALVQRLTVEDIRAVFKASAEIAGTVHSWYRSWTGYDGPSVAQAVAAATSNARPAIQVFRGEAFRGFDGVSMTGGDLEFAQAHVRIFSGLYGVLRLMDAIEPYRLDFDTRLPGLSVKNVYQYWRETIVEHLADTTTGSGATGRAVNEPILNLASAEYGRVLKDPMLRDRVVDVTFLEESGGKRRTVGVYAKRARGRLARFIIDKRIDDPADLTAFDLDGYGYSAELSAADSFVFVAER